MLQRFQKKPRLTSIGSVSSSATVIGANSTFNGILQVEGDLRIDGSFQGQLAVSGQLIVNKGARVQAKISAQSVLVRGFVKGTISAEKVEILASGQVYADLSTNEFASSEGCHFRGEVTLLH